MSIQKLGGSGLEEGGMIRVFGAHPPDLVPGFEKSLRGQCNGSFGSHHHKLVLGSPEGPKGGNIMGCWGPSHQTCPLSMGLWLGQ